MGQKRAKADPEKPFGQKNRLQILCLQTFGAKGSKSAACVTGYMVGLDAALFTYVVILINK
jgi:hypothetical protein